MCGQLSTCEKILPRILCGWQFSALFPACEERCVMLQRWSAETFFRKYCCYQNNFVFLKNDNLSVKFTVYPEFFAVPAAININTYVFSIYSSSYKKHYVYLKILVCICRIKILICPCKVPHVTTCQYTSSFVFIN